jgi:uncharacterized protein YggE
MKRIWLVAVSAALVLALGAGGLVLAQNAGEEPDSGNGNSVSVNLSNQQTGIWVNGEGKVSVAPDVALVDLGVEAQAPTVAEAQSLASTSMDAIMRALKAAGVADKDIKTRYSTINRMTRWDDRMQREEVTGYRVANSVTAKIREIGKVGDIIDDVAAAGGDQTRVNGITFTVDNPAAVQKEARDKAMADAKAKAQQLADLGGVDLGSPTYINENTYYAPYPIAVPAMEGGMGRDMAVKTAISPGETDIIVNVQVAYAIE